MIPGFSKKNTELALAVPHTIVKILFTAKNRKIAGSTIVVNLRQFG